MEGSVRNPVGQEGMVSVKGTRIYKRESMNKVIYQSDNFHKEE